MLSRCYSFNVFSYYTLFSIVGLRRPLHFSDTTDTDQQLTRRYIQNGIPLTLAISPYVCLCRQYSAVRKMWSPRSDPMTAPATLTSTLRPDPYFNQQPRIQIQDYPVFTLAKQMIRTLAMRTNPAAMGLAALKLATADMARNPAVPMVNPPTTNVGATAMPMQNAVGTQIPLTRNVRSTFAAVNSASVECQTNSAR